MNKTKESMLDETTKEKKTTTQKTPKIFACLAYGFVSVSITLFNKAIFSVYKFHYPAFVTLMQVILSIFFLVFLGVTQVIDFGLKGGRTGIFGLKLTTARKVFPLAFFWMLYVQSGLLALRHLTVPMFSALRRSTTLVAAVGEYLILGKVTPCSSMAAILVMVAGAAIAWATDLSFNARGYVWVGICVLSTATFLILIRVLGKELELNQHALLLYNNLLSLPMMLVWFIFATDEPKDVFSAPQWTDPSFVVFLLISASQAFLLNLCVFWCTTVNSALVTTVVGEFSTDLRPRSKLSDVFSFIYFFIIFKHSHSRANYSSQNAGQVKDIATTSLGLFVFKDVILNAINLFGVGLGLSGGVAYSAISYNRQ